MVAYGKVKTRGVCELKSQQIRESIVIKKAVERRRNKVLRYPRLQDN